MSDPPALDLLRPCGSPAQTHLQWAARVARGVARYCGFRRGSQERAEVEATAAYHLVRKARLFRAELVPPGGDADMLFRGWVHASIRAECLREARRLRGGGTFRSPRAGRHVRVEGLPVRRTADGFAEVDLPARAGGAEDEPAEEWSPYCTDPD